jgi:hypothetical protein
VIWHTVTVVFLPDVSRYSNMGTKGLVLWT